MRDLLSLLLSLIAGIALGAFFFQGLWWTIRRGLASPMPAAWFLLSLMLRSLVVVTGFILVSHGSWRRLLACLGGFFAARIAVNWRMRERLPVGAERLGGADPATTPGVGS